MHPLAERLNAATASMAAHIERADAILAAISVPKSNPVGSVRSAIHSALDTASANLTGAQRKRAECHLYAALAEFESSESDTCGYSHPDNSLRVIGVIR